MSEIQIISDFGQITSVPFPEVWLSKSVQNPNILVWILDILECLKSERRQLGQKAGPF